MSKLLLCVGFASLMSASCKDGGGTSFPTSPSGPPSAYTGTLSRQGGLAPLTVRWEASQVSVNNEGRLAGPMTLTNGGASVTFEIYASLSGNDSQGYDFLLGFQVNPGGVATLPNCTIRSQQPAVAPGRLRPPFAQITSSPFTINYGNCQGFIEPDPQRTDRVETGVVLTLSK